MAKDTHMILVERFYDQWGDQCVAEIWCEPYTDVLYIKGPGSGSGLTAMPDPETGLPLTLKNWKKYKILK